MPFSLDKTWKKVTAIIGTLSVAIGMTYTVFQASNAVATDKELEKAVKGIEAKYDAQFVVMNSAIQTNQRTIIVGQITSQITYWQEKKDRIEIKPNKTQADYERIKEYDREIHRLELQLQQLGGK